MSNPKRTRKEIREAIKKIKIKRELNIIPSSIRDEVLAAMKNRDLSKDMVSKWNNYLDFDLHDKLERYGYIGSARLYKIFSFKFS